MPSHCSHTSFDSRFGESSSSSGAPDDDGAAVRYSRIVKLRHHMGAIALVLFVGCSRPGSDLPRSQAIADAAASEASDVAETSTVFGNPAADPPAPAPATCQPASDLFLFATPNVAWTGAPLRVIAVTEKPIVGELRIRGGTKGQSG